MTQGVLAYKYEEEKTETGMTGLGGLPVYLDLMRVMGLPELIGKHLQVKQRGWTDSQMVLSLMLMNIAGGDCMEDLSKVEKDQGFCRTLRHVEQRGMKRADRRAMERRWRKERWRSVPSPSSVFNAGPDDSIWRTGGKAGRERTLATWIVSLPKDAPPEIFIRLANPSESERTMRIPLDGSFWKRENTIIF